MKYAFFSLALFLSCNLLAENKHYGIYSNMSASDGHFAGFEVFYTPEKLVFQIAEGWPKDPILLNIHHDKENTYKSKHPDMGEFILTFQGDTLELLFPNMSYKQVLKKGKSFWQK
jgi:hypothetical protein